MGAACVPKAEGRRGEDAYFADHSVSTFGIADGAGSWAKEGVDSGLFSRDLLRRTRAALQRRAQGLQRPDLPGVLRAAWEELKEEKARGSCTVLLGQMQGDNLTLLHLGDSGVLVARPSELLPEFLGGQMQKVLRSIHRSTPILHKQNMPFQLSSEDEEGEDLEGLDLVSIRMRVGDLVVAGCDGLFDNLKDEDIEALALELREGRAARGPAVAAQGLAERLCGRAAEAARAEGGKLDDITVLVAEAAPWSASPAGGLLENFDEPLDVGGSGASAASASAAGAAVSHGASMVAEGRRRRSVALGAARLEEPRLQTRAASTASTSCCSLHEGALVRYQPLGAAAGELEGRVGRLLGQGSYAEVWELLLGEGTPGAVLKRFRPAEAVLACLFGEDYRREVEEQYERERQAGERLHTGPSHPGRFHVAHLLSPVPRIVGEPGPWEAGSESDGASAGASAGPVAPMLVLEHAGTVLEGSVADALDLAGRLSVVDELLQAVAYLRLMGVVHADISMSNCCLGADGRVRLMDFGSAVLLEGAPSRGASPCKRLERLRTRYLHHPRFPAAERYAHPLLLGRLVAEIERPRGLDVYGQRYDPDHLAGNLAATPPEALRGMLVPGFSDVYGVAVLLWQLLTGEETPFEIEVECERARFEGWARCYARDGEERVRELRERLEAALLPQLRHEVGPSTLDALAAWLADALSEAPESRVGAAAGLSIGANARA